MILVIDNYDSFTYNLCQYLEELGAECMVVRNDKITISEIKKLNPEAIVISPGPGNPSDSGISIAIVTELSKDFPILGVCLGHQVIGEVFGGKIKRAAKIVHGKTAKVFHVDNGIYKGISNPFQAVRYHSLIIEKESLPECLEITSQTSDGSIMGVRHKEYLVEGVQFHPESIMTFEGKNILNNFLNSVKQRNFKQAALANC